ncbi:putative membrane protein [Hydrogenimonas thermophila]|uniref:Putative membrane protein n=2 Tax=Hydrogenimonas thermophila TaxID=223786 RepID=A0A1I5LN80_9BACT|nr:putative membrane protein [Hydrogenimonas thermophila]
MFENGFLGTSAPFYMDLSTLYFALLPVLMAMAVLLAVKKLFKAHAYSQMGLFILTIIVVLYFEIGVRLDGGYFAYIEKTSLPKDKMAIYMIVHIFIALVSTLVWGYHTIRSFKEFIKTKSVYINHKVVGRFIFTGMTITSFMGVGVYWLLFVQGIS